MSGTTRTSADLDPRRKRLLYRAWHRGMREMDLIMGPFCDARIAALSEAELDDLERLIEVPDRDLYGWITDPAGSPPQADSPLLEQLRTFHTHLAPRFS